jgi:hypothetical protein
MKIIVFTGAHGDFDMVNEVINSHKTNSNDFLLSISLGNLGFLDRRTPVKKFYGKRFLGETEQPLAYIKDGKGFLGPVYSLYGSIDDLFARCHFPNLMMIERAVIPFIAYKDNQIGEQTPTINRNVLFFSGYYSRHFFRKRNYYRSLKTRHKKANALCAKDFSTFRNENADVWFTHEVPANIWGKDKKTFGSMYLFNAIKRKQPKLVFCGHQETLLETTIGDTKVISLPRLSEGYAMLDLYNLEYQIAAQDVHSAHDD